VTFTDAALTVLRSASALTAGEITAEALRQGLLDVVGRDPQATMADRLLAELRRPERRIVVDARGRYSLAGCQPRPAAAERHQETLRRQLVAHEEHQERRPQGGRRNARGRRSQRRTEQREQAAQQRRNLR